MTTTIYILICIIIALTLLNIRLKLRQPSEKHHFMLSDRLSLHVSNNDVMQFFKYCSANLRLLLENKGIDFKIRCEPESMMGWIDTELLDKILLLLISDTLKRTEQRGKVTIDTYTNQQYDKITIKYSDSGSKISETNMLMINYIVVFHRGTMKNEYDERQGNIILIDIPIKKDAYETEQLDTNISHDFNIPNNIELHVPKIEIPTGIEEGNNSLREIIQAPHSADQEFLRRAIQCVNNNINDSDYDRQAFAADMGCSISTLYNKIRELTGKNISNFIRDLRIKKACKLAKENTDLRVSDIAYQVGFKDPKYFATSFKRVTGAQPKEYFNKLRETDV